MPAPAPSASFSTQSPLYVGVRWFTYLGIIGVLVYEAAAFFSHVSIFEYLTGTRWAPLLVPQSFGVIPLLTGTLYLTDYLTRHFDRLVWQGLGLDRHPELLDDYFGNYRRVVYLAQTDDAGLTREAMAAADRIGLSFERRWVGYGEMEPALLNIEGGRPPSNPPTTPVHHAQAGVGR